MKSVKESTSKNYVSENKRKPGRTKSGEIKGISRKYEKNVKETLIDWYDNNYFDTEKPTSIRKLAEWAIEKGFFHIGNGIPLAIKSLELELGELWNAKHPAEVAEKKKRKEDKAKKHRDNN